MNHAFMCLKRIRPTA